MQWKKDPKVKYTDLCIFVDKHVAEIKVPGENPALEDKIYNYLWLILKAIAIKKKLLPSFSDYDGFAFYGAKRMFFALRQNLINQGKIVKGKQIKPITSCLNYMKAILYAMKLEYQKESFREIIDEEFVSKKFDAFAFKATLKESVRQSQDSSTQFKYLALDSLKNINQLLDQTLERLPFAKGTIDYKKIRMSILLNCVNSLKSKNKLNDNLNIVLVWKLPKSMSSYIGVLVKEFYALVKTELMEHYKSTSFEDSDLDKMLTYKDGTEYNYED